MVFDACVVVSINLSENMSTFFVILQITLIFKQFLPKFSKFISNSEKFFTTLHVFACTLKKLLL